jgi:predicted peptidase
MRTEKEIKHKIKEFERKATELQSAENILCLDFKYSSFYLKQAELLKWVLKDE